MYIDIYTYDFLPIFLWDIVGVCEAVYKSCCKIKFMMDYPATYGVSMKNVRS